MLQVLSDYRDALLTLLQQLHEGICLYYEHAPNEEVVGPVEVNQ